jgi:hypothetical protein
MTHEPFVVKIQRPLIGETYLLYDQERSFRYEVEVASVEGGYISMKYFTPKDEPSPLKVYVLARVDDVGALSLGNTVVPDEEW